MFKSVGIAAIEEVDLDEVVYNFAVAEDESYVSEGVVNHNCRCVPHPHPTTELANLTFRATQTAKVIYKAMTDRTQAALVELARAIAPAGEPMAKSQTATKADGPSTKKMPDHEPPPFQVPQVAQLDPGNPEHLLAFGKALHDHAHQFPKGHPQRKHVLAQYEHVRKEVDEWHRKRGAGDHEIKLPKAPTWVMGGAAHLTNPREFELAIHQAETREHLVELAHYYDAFHLQGKKAGADWDAVWQQLKLAIASLPGEDGTPPTGPRAEDMAPPPGKPGVPGKPGAAVPGKPGAPPQPGGKPAAPGAPPAFGAPPPPPAATPGAAAPAFGAPAEAPGKPAAAPAPVASGSFEQAPGAPRSKPMPPRVEVGAASTGEDGGHASEPAPGALADSDAAQSEAGDTPGADTPPESPADDGPASRAARYAWGDGDVVIHPVKGDPDA